MIKRNVNSIAARGVRLPQPDEDPGQLELRICRPAGHGE
jgi:hypothetical protein